MTRTPGLQGGHTAVPGGYGYLAPGRAEAQEPRAAAQERRSWGPGVLDSPGALRSSPSSPKDTPEGRAGRAQPLGCGALCPSWDRGQGGEVSSNRQHNEGGQGRAKKVGSRVKRPRAGSSLQMARCWESPQPHSSPETKAGGCEVWQFGLQVLVSITHPGQPSASLARPRPLGARRRPPFQPPLSARAILKRPVTWALWSLKLGEVGWRVWGVGAPVPRLGGGGVGGGGQGREDDGKGL